MEAPNTTCWTLVQGASGGRSADREEFARRYGPVVQAYLGARWRGTRYLQEVEDAVQEVFVECFRPGGLLDRVEMDRPGGFRAFLFGAARNVALRFETREGRRQARQTPGEVELDRIPGDDPTLSHAFDRAWALSLIGEAFRLLSQRCEREGERARRWVDLLRLASGEGLPIRKLAERWAVDADRLHDEYARARREFKKVLLEVVAFHHPSTPGEVRRECEELLGLVG